MRYYPLAGIRPASSPRASKLPRMSESRHRNKRSEPHVQHGEIVAENRADVHLANECEVPFDEVAARGQLRTDALQKLRELPHAAVLFFDLEDAITVNEQPGAFHDGCGAGIVGHFGSHTD